jgi:hypothetical protein
MVEVVTVKLHGTVYVLMALATDSREPHQRVDSTRAPSSSTQLADTPGVVATLIM